MRAGRLFVNYLLTSLMLWSSFGVAVANAATLLGVHISAQGTATRVAFSFADKIPIGWSVAGVGTQQLLVTLPQTHGASNTSFPGSAAVVGVTLTRRDSSVVALIQLTAPDSEQHFTQGNTLVIEVHAASPESQPRPQSSSAAAIQSGESNEQTEIIPLRYAGASEIAGVLANAGDNIPSSDQAVQMGSVFSLPTQNGPLNPQPTMNDSSEPSSVSMPGRRINEHIAIDRRLNAIILTGTADELARMAALVAQLDRAAPSVMLECEVIELSVTGQRDVGLDFTQIQGGPVGTASASIGSLSGTGSGGPPVFTGDFMGKIYATIAKGNGKVLAFPRVLAQSGTPAQILTGDAIPIVSTTVFPGPPVTTQTSINYITVGVNLKIVSRSSGDGTVVSRVFTEVTSVTNEVATPQGNVPEISLRQASTTATVRSGSSFVIGGLLEDQELHNFSRIPILSSIPLIGNLFKDEHDAQSASNLFVIVTPYVIAPNGSNEPPANLPKPLVPGLYPRAGDGEP